MAFAKDAGLGMSRVTNTADKQAKIQAGLQAAAQKKAATDSGVFGANTSTSSGSGSSSSSAKQVNQTTLSNAANTAYGNLQSQIYDIYAQQQAQAAEQQRMAQEMANNAYSQNVANLASALNRQNGAISGQASAARQNLYDSTNRNLQNVNTDADRALREAYVNRLSSQKNLGQLLSAQGISGGGAESSIASLLNNYGNARNNIETTRNENIADINMNNTQGIRNIDAQEASNLANAWNAYMEGLNQAENARANGLTNILSTSINGLNGLGSDYLNALSDAIARQASYQASTASATNPVEMLNVGAKNSQSATADATTNYAQWLKNTQALADGGLSDSQIATQLANAGANNDLIARLLNQLA